MVGVHGDGEALLSIVDSDS